MSARVTSRFTGIGNTPYDKSQLAGSQDKTTLRIRCIGIPFVVRNSDFKAGKDVLMKERSGEAL